MKKTKSKVFLLIFILSAIICGILLYKVFKPANSLENTPPENILTSEELLTEFDLNEKESNQKYVGKVLVIKGKIKETINEDSNTIITMCTNDSFSTIICNLSDKVNTKLDLKEGQEISIKGECSGKLLDVIMVNCNIILEQ